MSHVQFKKKEEKITAMFSSSTEDDAFKAVGPTLMTRSKWRNEKINARRFFYLAQTVEDAEESDGIMQREYLSVGRAENLIYVCR